MTRTPILLSLLVFAACGGSKQVPSQPTASIASPIEAACEAGTATSCLVAANDAEADPVAAARWYGRACELGAHEGCAHAGNLLGEAQRFEEAQALFRKGCEVADAPSCFGLGLLAQGGYGGEPDLAAARTAYERSCDLGLGSACGELAKLVEVATPPNPEEARRLWEVACDRGDGASCRELGTRHWETDPEATGQWMERACVAELPDVQGCVFHGMTLTESEDPAEQARGEAMLRSTCENGAANGCMALAQILSTKGELEQRDAFLAQACAYAPTSCDRFRAILSADP